MLQQDMQFCSPMTPHFLSASFSNAQTDTCLQVSIRHHLAADILWQADIGSSVHIFERHTQGYMARVQLVAFNTAKLLNSLCCLHKN